MNVTQIETSRKPQFISLRQMIQVVLLAMLVVTPFRVFAADDKAPANKGADALPELRISISWNGNVRVPEFADGLATFIRSDKNMALAAAKEKLTIPPDEAAKATWVRETTSNYRGRIDLQIGMDMNAAVPDSPEKIRQYELDIARRLSDVVAKYTQFRADELVGLAQRETREVQRKVVDLKERAKQLQAVIHVNSGLIDVSVQGMHNAISSLEQEKQKLSIDAVGQKARLLTLRDTIKQLSDQIEKKIESDQVAGELMRLVKIREQEVARVQQMVKAGTAPLAEENQAEAHWAEARAKLLERRETAAKAAGGDLLGELNKEMLLVSVSAAETEARRDYAEKALKKLADVLSLVDDFAEVKNLEAEARLNLTSAEAKLDAARRESEIISRPTMETREVLRSSNQ